MYKTMLDIAGDIIGNTAKNKDLEGAVLGAKAGIAVGTAMATPTLLGSTILGSAAATIGLISTPMVSPVVICGAVGTFLGFGLHKGIKKLSERRQNMK